MRRIAVKNFGGPEELALEERESLRPGEGEALVGVEAAGVNYLDVYMRQGRYNPPQPFYPGLEGVGRVQALGSGVTGFEVGQRVAWVDVPASYASGIVAPAARLIPVPDSFTANQALLFQALTAEYLVAEYRQIKPGDRALVHSAAGGVGLLLVQWLKHLGAWVVGTVSSGAKAQSVRDAGADAVIDYGQDYGFLDDLMRLTEGRGVDLAVDGVGAATLLSTIEGLATGGTVVVIGSASGPAPAVDPSLLTMKAKRLASGSIMTYVADHSELQRRSAIVIEAVQAGWLRIDEGTPYDLAQAAQAHRDIEGRGTKGKLYLTP